MIPVFIVGTAALLIHAGQRMATGTPRDKPTGKEPETIALSKEVDWQPAPDPSGYVMRYVLRNGSSSTTGRLIIKLPDWDSSNRTCSFKHNFRNLYRVSPVDMHNLSTALTEEVRLGRMKPETCLDILRVLETTTIGTKRTLFQKVIKNKPFVGFVNPEAAFLFDRLKAMCQRRSHRLLCKRLSQGLRPEIRKMSATDSKLL